MLPSTTAVIKVLHLSYNKSNIRFMFCNKCVKAFIEGQMFKDTSHFFACNEKLLLRQ